MSNTSGRRRGRDFWAGMIAEYEREDLSQAEFCESQGLSVWTFRGWLYRLRSEAQRERPRFVEVVGVVDAPTPGCIVRAGQTQIEFRALPDPGYLAELLAELEEREP